MQGPGNAKTIAIPVVLAALGILVWLAWLPADFSRAELSPELSPELNPELTDVASGDSGEGAKDLQQGTAENQDSSAQSRSLAGPADVGSASPRGELDSGLTKESPGPAAARFVSHLEILKEIATRLSLAQFEEGESELRAFIEPLDDLSESDKLAFLYYFIDFSSANSFNPELVAAFDTAWSSLTLSQASEIESARTLASHYANHFEFAFALTQFRILSEHGVELTPTLRSELAYSQFSMQQYRNAISTLERYVAGQETGGANILRRDYSILFESYYRSGDLAAAEAIGARILEVFNDIQDWRDMAQFYEAIGDATVLRSHLNSARERGLLDEQGFWQEGDLELD